MKKRHVFRTMTNAVHDRQKQTGLIVVLISAIVLGVLVSAAYAANADWTGLSDPQKPVTQSIAIYAGQKTVWNWMQVLLVPVVVGLGAVYFTTSNDRRNRQLAVQKEAADGELSDDTQREAALQAYLDRMSELLLDQDLLTPTGDERARIVARARTLTVLPRLDDLRKARVLQFLYEAQLMNTPSPVVELHGANVRKATLREANLRAADLRAADLSATNLSRADLTAANVSSAILSRAILSAGKLSRADLSRADLRGANLRGADLIRVHLYMANVRGADLSGALLLTADLTGADLRGANLTGADLTGADLTETILDGADVKDTVITDAQIMRAASSVGIKNRPIPRDARTVL